MGKKKPTTKPKGNGRPASAKKPTPGCYVLSLTVENIRCFGPKQTLDCSDGEYRPRQWTVILGDNGTGKSTLLQAIVLHERTPNIGLPAAEMNEPDRLPMLVVYHAATWALPRHVSCRAESLLSWSELTWARSHRDNGTVAINYPLGWRIEGDRWTQDWRRPEADALGFAAYGANRSQVNAKDVGESTGAAVRTLMSAQHGLRDCQEWLLLLDYSAKASKSNIQARQNQLLGEVQELLLGVLPDVHEMRFDGGSGVFPQPRVEFLTPYGWVPLRQLGHGYQTMIAWVVDFVSRMVERYPESENPLAEPAVCLVDEIDLHLHPVWQRKVIGYLSERFPNTQFIVTAHSPLVVQAAASANANIAVLVRSTEKDADGNHYVEIRNNPEDVRNWRLDQILTSDLFGMASARPVEVDVLFTRKQELLDKAKLSKVEQDELGRIEEQLRELPFGETKGDRSAIQDVRQSLELLKRKLAQ